MICLELIFQASFLSPLFSELSASPRLHNDLIAKENTFAKYFSLFRKGNQTFFFHISESYLLSNTQFTLDLHQKAFLDPQHQNVLSQNFYSVKGPFILLALSTVCIVRHLYF